MCKSHKKSTKYWKKSFLDKRNETKTIKKTKQRTNVVMDKIVLKK